MAKVTGHVHVFIVLVKSKTLLSFDFLGHGAFSLRSEIERSLPWINWHVLVRLELAADLFSDRMWIIDNLSINMEALKA